MKLNVKQILEGYTKKNLAKIKLLSQETRDLSEKRYAICLACTLFKNNRCNPDKTIVNIKTNELVKGCGCNLSAKVYCKECHCPANFW